MSVQTPLYEVRFYSGSTLRYGFGHGWTNKVLSLKIRPGLTSAIGSFEITLPNTGSSGESFAGINPYEDVHLWYGYSYKGSYDFKGKIDTIKSDFSKSRGYTRTYIGRDYGEALFRTLVRRSYGIDPLDRADEVAIDLADRAGLAEGGAFIEAASLTVYPLTLSNDTAFEGIKQISDFDNRDFYVDTSRRLRWFERQSKSGPESFSVGSNIFRHRFYKDITDVKNRYYIFGMRDSAGITGSDWPINHDDWTESDVTGWFGWIYSAGYPTTISEEMTIYAWPDYLFDRVATGSYSIYAEALTIPTDETCYAYLRKYIPNRPVHCNDGDILHFYCGHKIEPAIDVTFYFRLSTSTNHYYQTRLDSQHDDFSDDNFPEYTINLGPTYEGVSATGSVDTVTGSYRWERTGDPDWYDINQVALYCLFTTEDISSIVIFLDGLYIGTRFQYMCEDGGSQTAYNFRPEVIINNKYNSTQYCKNVGDTLLATNKDLTTQIEIITTGSPDLNMGYRYPITIPAENISAQNFELIDLEHRFDGAGGFTSKCLFTDKPQIRTIIPIIDYPVQEVLKTKKWWTPFIKYPF